MTTNPEVDARISIDASNAVDSCLIASAAASSLGGHVDGRHDGPPFGEGPPPSPGADHRIPFVVTIHTVSGRTEQRTIVALNQSRAIRAAHKFKVGFGLGGERFRSVSARPE